MSPNTSLAALHARISRALQAGAINEAARLLLEAPANHNFDVLRGIMQQLQGNYAEAARFFGKAMEHAAAPPEALLNWAQSMLRLRKADAVIARLETAIAARPLPAAQVLLAEAYEQQGNLSAAVAALGQARQQGLKTREITSNYWLNRRKLCDWAEPLPEFTAQDLTPAAATVLSDDPALQRLTAESWCRSSLPPVAPARPKPIVQGRRIKIGYLSSDIHHHATAYLMAGLFERHTRANFEVLCFSYGKPDTSAIRTRIMQGVEHFIDLYEQPAAAALKELHNSNLDILVDLKGHTRGHALSWLCSRPAPIQLHYLGHPGTIGGAGIDYLIGDPTTTPNGCEHFYAEKLLRHPTCYQVNDVARPIGATLPRAAHGLPEQALVLACFNQTYKITPEVFAIWCRLLQARPEAVLWLYSGGNGVAEANLRAAAASHGIQSTRLYFATATDNAAHLARYHAVDVVLDTYPYGSHTTASDALWVGAPLVTRMGPTFPSRVAASLLQNVGLPQLITDTQDAYEVRVQQLMDSPEERAALRAHLLKAKQEAPLFDTAAWVKKWETMLRELVQAH